MNLQKKLGNEKMIGRLISFSVIHNCVFRKHTKKNTTLPIFEII